MNVMSKEKIYVINPISLDITIFSVSITRVCCLPIWYSSIVITVSVVCSVSNVLLTFNLVLRSHLRCMNRNNCYEKTYMYGIPANCLLLNKFTLIIKEICSTSRGKQVFLLSLHFAQGLLTFCMQNSRFFYPFYPNIKPLFNISATVIKFLPLEVFVESHRSPQKIKNTIYYLQISVLVPEIFKFEKMSNIYK